MLWFANLYLHIVICYVVENLWNKVVPVISRNRWPVHYLSLKTRKSTRNHKVLCAEEIPMSGKQTSVFSKLFFFKKKSSQWPDHILPDMSSLTWTKSISLLFPLLLQHTVASTFFYYSLYRLLISSKYFSRFPLSKAKLLFSMCFRSLIVDLFSMKRYQLLPLIK